MGNVWHNDVQANFRMSYVPDRDPYGRAWSSSDILAIRDRTARVQIENVDAIQLLERIVSESSAVVYCDPPYRNANTVPYRYAPDWDALTEVLREQKGRVAISGYADDWDHLGWRCESYATYVRVYHTPKREIEAKPRTEKLWMNYDPVAQGLFAT